MLTEQVIHTDDEDELDAEDWAVLNAWKREIQAPRSAVSRRKRTPPLEDPNIDLGGEA